MKRAWPENQGRRGGGRGRDADFIRQRQRFSGFFGPSDKPTEEEQVVEVGLLVRLHWVGQLIGKKGVTIRELKKKSAANMNFGDDEIDVDHGKYNVMAISGTRDQVSKACVGIAEKLGEITQSEDWKLVFLIPNSYCGMFIGKKGANVKKMKGDAGDRLWIKLSEDPISLPGANEVTACSIYGAKIWVKNAIEEAAITLGDISASIKAELEKIQPPQRYGGDFGRVGGGPTSYGGGFKRDLDNFGGGGHMAGVGGGGTGYRSIDVGGYGRGGGGDYGRGGGGRGYESRGQDRRGGYGRESPTRGSGRFGWGRGGASSGRRGWE